MISAYFNITVIAEWCTFFAALLLLDRKTGAWRMFTPLLLLTVAVETAGWYMIYILKSSNNTPLFNLLMILNMTYFIWLPAQSELLQKNKKAIYAVLGAFLLFSLVNLCRIQGFSDYNFYTEIAGDLALLIICCVFYYNILREEKMRNLFRYEYFWLAAGLLFNAIGSIVLYIFIHSLMAYFKETRINVYGYLNYGVNLLFYTSLIIAFICRRKNTK